MTINEMIELNIRRLAAVKLKLCPHCEHRAVIQQIINSLTEEVYKPLQTQTEDSK